VDGVDNRLKVDHVQNIEVDKFNETKHQFEDTQESALYTKFFEGTMDH